MFGTNAQERIRVFDLLVDHFASKKRKLGRGFLQEIVVESRVPRNIHQDEYTIGCKHFVDGAQ